MCVLILLANVCVLILLANVRVPILLANVCARGGEIRVHALCETISKRWRAKLTYTQIHIGC